MGEKKNKGEWSELYVFAKLFREGRLAIADSDLKPLPGQNLSVMSLKRGDSSLAESFVPLSVDPNQYPTSAWLDYMLEDFLDEISRGKGAFNSNAGDEILKAFGLSQVKASSGEKVDLVAVLAGLDGLAPRELGFSVKSRLGGPSTLLNASEHTKITFKVVSDGSRAVAASDEIIVFGSGESIESRIAGIRSRGMELSNGAIDSATFSYNLSLIDSALPALLPRIILFAYERNLRSIPELVQEFSRVLEFNPLQIEAMIKRLLFDIALGMVPGSPWDGRLRAYGGYMVVEGDGKVVALHLDNPDTFKEFLYKHVKLDTPSTSRLGIAQVTRASGELIFKLAVQLRFVY